MVNMKFTNAHCMKLLNQLADLAKIAAPDDIADVEAFLALQEKAYEVDSGGRRTRAASEARRMLANPHMVSTPMARSIAARRKKSLKYAAQANEAFVKAVGALGVAIQAELELAAHQEAETLPDNRKGDPQVDTAEADLKFIEVWLRDMGIKPYELARLPHAKRDLIARLLNDARNDRADNVWPLLFHAGLLSTPGVELTPHERALLAEACDRNQFDHATLLRDLEHQTGEKLDVSASFAASCELIAQRAAELGSVEAMLIFCAHGEQVSREADIVSAMLPTPVDDRWRIEAAIQSIKMTGETAHALRNDDIAKAVASLVAGIREADTRGHDKAEWISLILHNFVEKSSFVTQFSDEPRQFYALFTLALRLSGLDQKYPYREVAPQEILDRVIDEVPFRETDNFDRAWEVSSYVAEAEASTDINRQVVDSVDPPPPEASISTAIEITAIDESSIKLSSAKQKKSGSEIVIWREPQSQGREVQPLVSGKSSQQLNMPIPDQSFQRIRQENLE
jgi:hypothetical protein